MLTLSKMTLVSAGWNEFGQLGREGDSKTLLPVDIPPSEFKCFAAGQLHSVAVTNNGEVYGWGSCEDGGLGFPGKPNIQTPTKLDIDQKIQSVSCGFCNTILLAESGDVIVITDGDPWKADLPEQAILVCCGYYTLWAAGRSGAIYQCGSTKEEAVTKYEIPVKPIQLVAGNGYAVAIGENGDAYGIGDVVSGQPDSGNTFLQIESLKGIKIKKVSSFDSHCIAISTAGQAYAFGSGGQGRLGLGGCDNAPTFQQLTCFDSNKVIDASAGSSHTCFIMSDFSVYGCGNN